MSPKAMKRLGITFMVIGIACYAVAIVVWFGCLTSLTVGNSEHFPYYYIIFALCCIISGVGYGAIPLLIMAHIRTKREKRKAEAKARSFCTQCGFPQEPQDMFCKNCGKKHI